jgi:hypothetical protein
MSWMGAEDARQFSFKTPSSQSEQDHGAIRASWSRPLSYDSHASDEVKGKESMPKRAVRAALQTGQAAQHRPVPSHRMSPATRPAGYGRVEKVSPNMWVSARIEQTTGSCASHGWKCHDRGCDQQEKQGSVAHGHILQCHRAIEPGALVPKRLGEAVVQPVILPNKIPAFRHWSRAKGIAA